MNVYIRDRQTGERVARYEIHLVEGGRIPPEQRYFDATWKLALAAVQRLIAVVHRVA